MANYEDIIHASAVAMLHNSNAFLLAKRKACNKIKEILTQHPENTVIPPVVHEISALHYSETLEELYKLDVSDDENARLLPASPKEARGSSKEARGSSKEARGSSKEARSSSKKKSSSSPKSPKNEGKNSPKFAFLRQQYKKIIEAIGSKWEQVSSEELNETKDQIFYILSGMQEMEFDLQNLENSLKSLQETLENSDSTTELIQHKVRRVDAFLLNADDMYEVSVEFVLSYNKKLKKYVHSRLGKYKYVKQPRRSGRLARDSVYAPQDHQQPSTSKRMAKQADKAPREKKSETQPPVDTTAGRMVPKASKADRDVAHFEESGSTDETSQDSISTRVYDSVEDMALSESEGDVAEKFLSKSAVKKVGTATTGTKSDIPEPKDVAETGAKPKSKHSDTKTGTKPKIKRDDTKTGAKPKKVNVKKTPTKSKTGYSRVNQSDSDED